MKLKFASLVVAAAACVSATVRTSRSGDDNEKQLKLPETVASEVSAPAYRQLQAGTTTTVTTGFVTISFGTDTACTPVSAVIRVQLGVCVQEGTAVVVHDDMGGERINKPSYAISYVQSTGTTAQLLQDEYSDAACATAPVHTYTLVTFSQGCGLVQVDRFNVPSLQYGANDDLGGYGSGKPSLGLPSPLPKYATVTYDAGFYALPATTSVSGTWKAVAVYANADACDQPTTNTPVFFAATPVAVMDTCTVNVACAGIEDIRAWSFWGSTYTEGCITVTPQASGYMMVTQWTGEDPRQVRRPPVRGTRTASSSNTPPSPPAVRPQCTGSIFSVPLVATLGQCFAGTAKAGVTTVTNTGRFRGALADPH